jgi:hypothetical protein
MKTIIATLLTLACGMALAAGSHSVKGYTKKDGTYVAPSHATNPNSTKTDNYSSKGNVNPYTGKEGTKDPYAIEPAKPRKKK